jgi:hypothetical protein
LGAEKRRGQDARKKDSAQKQGLKEELKQLLMEDRDLLKAIVEQTLQQVLEAEMEDALQPAKENARPGG